MCETKKFSCGDCGVTNCNSMDSKYPDFCLTTHMDESVKDAAMAIYENETNRKIMMTAADIEHEFYCQYTRLEETIEFAKRMGVKKIGIATCVGLIRETRMVTKILRHHGFEVYGTCCKVGAVKKVDMGIPAACAESTGKNACNPIMQAKLLNQAGTDLNVLMGLCVGHDSLFYKYCEGLCTTLFTKDRILAHNAAAIFSQANGYYKKKLFD